MTDGKNQEAKKLGSKEAQSGSGASDLPSFPASMPLPVHTLADECRLQLTRVRDEVMPAYLEIGPAGAFALAEMRAASDRAIRALSEQDGVEVLALVRVLQSFTT